MATGRRAAAKATANRRSCRSFRIRIWALRQTPITCAIFWRRKPRQEQASDDAHDDGYVEIRQLVNRYAFALDSGSSIGYDYADLFAADGAFMRPYAKGREQLAALARGPRLGPDNTVHVAGSSTDACVRA